jgi:cytochrome c oxidase cbb3-type subunit IV
MNMPVLHAIYTLILVVVFTGIVIWAWGKGRQQDFKQAADLVFTEEQSQPRVENMRETERE